MQIAADPMLHVIQQGGGALANAGGIIPMAIAASEPGRKRGFEEQPLAIDNFVVLVLTQTSNKRTNFTPCRRRKGAVAPAPLRDGNDLVYGGVKTNKRCKG